MEPTRIQRSHPAVRWGGYALGFLVLYVLSSGPVLGMAFWLREATGIDQFYAVFWLYYPLFIIAGSAPDGLWGNYIEWWVVDVFHTVGPG